MMVMVMVMVMVMMTMIVTMMVNICDDDCDLVMKVILVKEVIVVSYNNHNNHRVAESAAPLHRRCEPSKDLVSQSLSSKLTCERERWLKRLLNSCSQLRARSRERSAHKALELLLTAHSAFERERERDQLTRLLNSCSQRVREREIGSQGS